MVAGGEGSAAMLGGPQSEQRPRPQGAVLSLGKLARKQFRVVLEESDPHAVNLKTGERADVKLVGNAFYFATQIHDATGEAKLAACPAR
eukprot:9075507-Pyramimonas_sp.AAC.1